MAGPLKVLGFIFCLFSFNIVRGQGNSETPTLRLIPITKETRKFVKCVIEDFYSLNNLTVQWKVNDIISPIQPKLEYGLKGLYTAYSLYEVSSEIWNTNTDYTCEITHRGQQISVRNNFNRNPQTPTLSLVPVTTEKSTFVMCVIEDFYPKDLIVQWRVNDIPRLRQSKLEYELNDEGLYTAHSLYRVSTETWKAKTLYTCEVTHQGQQISVKKNFNSKLTLTLKPPIVRELFVHNKVVLEAVVSGDEQKTVQEASVSCTVNNVPVSSVPGNIIFSQDISHFIRIDNITIDKKKWFDGEMVICSIHDTKNNRDIKKEIHFDKGDGQKPSVVIYRPDYTTDTASLVCKVTSHKLGDVYIMWKVGNEPYTGGSTSAHIHQRDSKSVLSILTMSKEKFEDPRTTFTCTVKHANMVDTGSPLQVSTSKEKHPECPVD